MEPDLPERDRAPVRARDRAPVRAEAVASPGPVPEKEKIPGADAGPKTGQDRDADSPNRTPKKTRAVVIAHTSAQTKEVKTMPGYDRRGPFGEGPMTGGGRGYCNTAAQEYRSFRGYGYGRGAGPGRGFRSNRGFRAGFGWGPPAGYETYPEGSGMPDPGINELKAAVHSLQESLDAMTRRLTELEKSR